MNEDVGIVASVANQASTSQAAKKLKGHGHPVRCMSVVRGPKFQSLLMTWEKTFQLVSLGGPSGQRSTDSYQKVASWTSTFTATCVASNSSGVTWVGYADGSVAVLQPRNGTLEPEKPQVMFNTSPTAITVSDETGEAWIGDSTGRLKVVHHRGYRIKHEKYAFDPDPDHPELSDILAKSRGSVACLLLVGQTAIIGLSCRRSTISVRSVKKAELLDVCDLKGAMVEPPTCLSQVPPEHGSRDGSTNIISGHAAGKVLLWKLQEGKLTLLAQLCRDIGGIRGIVYFPDLPVLLLGHDGGIISLLAMPHILQPPVISPPGTRPTPWPWHNVVLKVHRYGLVAFCASSDFVITSSYLGTVRAYPHRLLLAEAKKYGFKISRHYDVLTHTSVGDPDGWGVVRRGDAAVPSQGSTEMVPHQAGRPPPLTMDSSSLVTDSSDPPAASRVLRSTHASRIQLSPDVQAMVSQALPEDARPDEAWAAARRPSGTGGRSGPLDARRPALPAARLEENGDISVRGPRVRTPHASGGPATPIEIPRHAAHASPHGQGPPTPEPHVHNITNFGNLSPRSSSTLPGSHMQAAMANQMDSDDHLARLLQQTFGPGQIILYSELGEMSYLGQGSYGTVHHAKWQGTEVAIKQLMNVKSLDDPNAHSFVNEVRMLQRVCHHPNVMRMCGVCLKPPMLVTQYYRNGPLVKLLTSALQGDPKSMKILTWQKRLSMLHDIATAMIHLHKQGIVHADLRTPNIFLTSDWKIQIGDFGLAREVGQMGSVHMSEPTHPRYRPPEVFKQMMWNPAADVWTFGVIMWEMLTWKPAAQMTMAHTAQVVLAAHNDPDSLRPRMPTKDDIQGKVGTGLDSYKDLMMACLSMDPIHRPTFEHISSRLSNLLLWNTVKIQLVTAAHKQVLMLNAIKSMKPCSSSDSQSLKSTPSETESDVGLNRKAREIIAAGIRPASGSSVPPGLPAPQRRNPTQAALPYRKPDPEPFGPESLIAHEERAVAKSSPATQDSSSMPRAADPSGSNTHAATPTTTRDFAINNATTQKAPGGHRPAPADAESVSPPMTPTKYSPFAHFSPGRSPRHDSPSQHEFSSGIPASPFLAWSPTSSPQPSPRASTASTTTPRDRSKGSNTPQKHTKDSVTFQPTSTTDIPSSSTPPGSPYTANMNGPFHAFMDNLSFSPQVSPRPSALTSPRPATSQADWNSQGTSNDAQASTSRSSQQGPAGVAGLGGGVKGLTPLPKTSSSVNDSRSEQPDGMPALEKVARNEHPLPLIIGMVTALQLAAPQTSAEQALECLKVMVSFRFQGDWAGVREREEEGVEDPSSVSAPSSSVPSGASAPAPTLQTNDPMRGFHVIGTSSMIRAASEQPVAVPMSATSNLLPSSTNTIDEDENIYPVQYPTVNFATNPYDSFSNLPSRSSRTSWPFEHLTTSGSNADKLAEVCDDAARVFNEMLRSSTGRSISRNTSGRDSDYPTPGYVGEFDGTPSLLTPPNTRPTQVPIVNSRSSERDMGYTGDNSFSHSSSKDPAMNGSAQSGLSKEPATGQSVQRSISNDSTRPRDSDVDSGLVAPRGLSVNVKKPAPVTVQPSASPPVTPTASPPPSPFSNSSNVFAVLAATQASPRNVSARLSTPEKSPRPAHGRSARPPPEVGAPPSPQAPTASQQSSQSSWADGANTFFDPPRTPGKSPRQTPPSWPNTASSYQEQTDTWPYAGSRPHTPPVDYTHPSPSHVSSPPPPPTNPYAATNTASQDPSTFSPHAHPANPYTQHVPNSYGPPVGYPGTDMHTSALTGTAAVPSLDVDTGLGSSAPPGYPGRHDGVMHRPGAEAASTLTSSRSGPMSPDSHQSLHQRLAEMATTSYPSDASRALFQRHMAVQQQNDSMDRQLGAAAAYTRTGATGAGMSAMQVRQLQNQEHLGAASHAARENGTSYATTGAGLAGIPNHSRALHTGMTPAVTSPPSPAHGPEWERQQHIRPAWQDNTPQVPGMAHMPRHMHSSAPHNPAGQSAFMTSGRAGDPHQLQMQGYDSSHAGDLRSAPNMSPASNLSALHDSHRHVGHTAVNPPTNQEARYPAQSVLGYQILERNPSSYSSPMAAPLTTTPSRSTSGVPALNRCGRLVSGNSRQTSDTLLAAHEAVAVVDGFPNPVQYTPPHPSNHSHSVEARGGDMGDARAAVAGRPVMTQPEPSAPTRSGSSFLTGINKLFVNMQAKRGSMDGTKR